MLESIKHALAKAGDKASTSSDSVPVLDGTPNVVDSRNTVITVAGHELCGVSVAGQETSIIFPRLKLAFDIGRCPQKAVHQQTVLVSHGHLDHIGGLPFHVFSRQLLNVPGSKIVVPPSYVDNVKRLISLTAEIQCIEAPEYEVIPLTVGQEYVLPSGNGHVARPFKTSHSIESQGYVVYSRRKKLRADLAGRSQDEIREMRMAGEEVTEVLEVPEIAFTGDTTSYFLDEPGSEDVFKARLLIMELSFIDDTVTVDQAREKGHMHIADFVAHAHKFQNEAILLIHFSSRYKRSDIVSALNTWLPPALRAKCVPLLNGFDG